MQQTAEQTIRVLEETISTLRANFKLASRLLTARYQELGQAHERIQQLAHERHTLAGQLFLAKNALRAFATLDFQYWSGFERWVCPSCGEWGQGATPPEHAPTCAILEARRLCN